MSEEERDDQFRRAMLTMTQGAIGQMKGRISFLPMVPASLGLGRGDLAIKWSAMTAMVLAIANVFGMQDIPVGDGPQRSEWVDKIMSKLDEAGVFEEAPDGARDDMKSVLTLATIHPSNTSMAAHYDDVMMLELDERGCGDEDCEVCKMLVRTKPPKGQHLQ